MSALPESGLKAFTGPKKTRTHRYNIHMGKESGATCNTGGR
jgi:hypothetical protein